MPRERGRETYESEAALRALRGISQVAVPPIASTGFHPSEQWQRQARTTSGGCRVYGVGVIVRGDATALFHLTVGTATPEKPVPAIRFSPIMGDRKARDFPSEKFVRFLRLITRNAFSGLHIDKFVIRELFQQF